jgi:hypothetical protein
VSDWKENNDRVEAMFSEAKTSSKTARLSCPFCEDDGHRDKKLSLVIRLETGRWKCYRCELRGRLRSVGEESFDEFEEDEDAPKEFQPPREFVQLAGNRSHTFRPALRYLASRGVDDRIVARIGIHACDEGFWSGRIIVPFLDPRNESVWLGWIARLWSKPKPNAKGVASMPYLYPADMAKGTYFLNHNAINVKTDRPVLTVEGSFDAFPYWPHVVACLGKPSHKQIAALKRAKRPVCVCLDGDAWEEGHMLACLLRFEGVPSGSIRLPAGEDPATVPPKLVRIAARVSIGARTPIRL